MLQQNEFDRFVENYNADYLYLLARASLGRYNCLISSFTRTLDKEFEQVLEEGVLMKCVKMGSI